MCNLITEKYQVIERSEGIKRDIEGYYAVLMLRLHKNCARHATVLGDMLPATVASCVLT